MWESAGSFDCTQSDKCLAGNPILQPTQQSDHGFGDSKVAFELQRPSQTKILHMALRLSLATASSQSVYRVWSTEHGLWSHQVWTQCKVGEKHQRCDLFVQLYPIGTWPLDAHPGWWLSALQTPTTTIRSQVLSTLDHSPFHAGRVKLSITCC